MPDLELHAPHGAAWLFFGVALVIYFGPWLAEKVRLPGLIGLLAGGFLIGQYGLGIVPADDTTVAALGQLGLLYLMFLAGAELDFDVIRRHRTAAIGFSLLTFGAPMVAGFAVSTALGYSIAASLLLGSIWASHTLLTYPAVREAGLASHPAVAAAVGATVVTDTLALIVLAGVAGSATGGLGGTDLLFQVVLGLLLLGAWCAVALPWLGRLFVARISHQPPLRYMFVLGALLSASVLAEVVGIEAIVGAFFAGLGLNRMLPNEGPMFERFEFFGAALMIPLFLVSVGLIINPAVMIEPTTIGLAVFFTIACLGGKALAAAACRWLFGYSWNETGLMFSLTAAQAAATLAATFVGFRIGLIGTGVVNAVLIVILVSVTVSSIAAEYFIRRLPPVLAEHDRPGRSVLLLDTGSGPIAPAVALAQRLAYPDGGVVRPIVAAFPDSDMAGMKRRLHELEAVTSIQNVDCEPVIRHDQSLVGAVLHAAASEDASIVVMAIDPATVRSTPELTDVLRSCPTPVFVVTSERPITRVRLEADDAGGTGMARPALDPALAQLRRAGIQVSYPGGPVLSRSLGLSTFWRTAEREETDAPLIVSWGQSDDAPLPADTAVVFSMGATAG